jgi:hypothetical protein
MQKTFFFKKNHINYISFKKRRFRMRNSFTYEDISQMSPRDLAIWLNNNYLIEIPTTLETCEDLKKAGVLLGKLTNVYSYIISMTTFAKLSVREAKRKKLDKELIDDCMDRKNVLEDFANTLKLQYTAISRMITVKKQIDDEMKMI